MMVHLIDKDALVAEIESLRKHYIEKDDYDNGWNYALDKILLLIEALEVKEVDLEKEIEEKAKAYDNALRKANWLEIVDCSKNEALEEIFPQLKDGVES